MIHDYDEDGYHDWLEFDLAEAWEDDCPINCNSSCPFWLDYGVCAKADDDEEV